MADTSATLVKTLQVEFQRLSSQLRREIREELQCNPKVNPSMMFPTSLEEAPSEEFVSVGEKKVTGPTLNAASAMKPLLKVLNASFNVWESHRHFRTAHHKWYHMRYMAEGGECSLESPNSFPSSSRDCYSSEDIPDLHSNGNDVCELQCPPKSFLREATHDASSDFIGDIPQMPAPHMHKNGLPGLPGEIVHDDINHIYKSESKISIESTPSSPCTPKPRKKKKESSSQKALGLVSSANIMREIGGQIYKLDSMQNRLRLCAIKIVSHSYFEPLSLAMVVINSIQIGVTTDIMARKETMQEPALSRMLEFLFCGIFFSEILVKLFAWDWRFFTMYGWGWNVFDLLVVCAQVVEQVVQFALGKELEHESSLLRLARFLRLLRVARVIRIMKFTEDLQVLLTYIINSSKGFLWSLFLLFLFAYVAGIYLCQVSMTAILEDNLTGDKKKAFVEVYGNVSLSILSLIQGISGGLDWSELVQPIREHVHPFGPVIAVLVVLFILFLIFVVLNVITGSFVEVALRSAQELKEIQRFNRARSFFAALDIDSTGQIEYSEISSHLESPVVQSFFEEMDVDASEAQSLFKMIDIDKSGSIDCEEFLLGCMRLQGPAKATDLLRVSSDVKTTFEKHWVALETLEEHLLNMSALVSRLNGLLVHHRYSSAVFTIQKYSTIAYNHVNMYTGEWHVNSLPFTSRVD